jgi:hypothetical protein
MSQISNAFKVKFKMFGWIGSFVLLTLSLFFGGCSKAPAANERADKNAAAGNAKQQDQSALMPHLQQNLTGDIERISLAISMARDAVKLDNWQEAVPHLRTARKEVDVALGREPRLRGEFEALRAAIDRAIPAVEGREKEAETRIAELQTRIGAIKVNSSL